MNAIAEPLPASSPAPLVRRSKPLLSLSGVLSLLGNRSQFQVLREIDSGGILWAFDCRAAGPKRLLRVLPAALADFMQGRDCKLQWPDVVALLVPPEPRLCVAWLAHILNVTPEHIYNLVRAKALSFCARGRRGRGGSALVPRNDFVRFLRQRRVL
ncbi:MAG: helix-turn-helix domain-containing protein [Verrucomicrobiota bacterium]|jgi:hypothetical protein